MSDLIRRTLWTFVEAFLAALLASGALGLDLAVYQSAALAGVAAALTVVLVYARQQLEKPWV